MPEKEGGNFNIQLRDCAMHGVCHALGVTRKQRKEIDDDDGRNKKQKTLLMLK